ncbi:MAG: hypothetical protein K2X81_16190 [Candidatus Obscuribacterales bacterium]|nr:hypothetical protein [Candidatus Obscuribacterales bacterium]
MITRFLITAMAFTLLWTGTFLHDQFGSKLSDVTNSIISFTQSFSAAEQGSNIAKADQCPCVSHLHSPLIVQGNDFENIVTAVQFLAIFIALGLTTWLRGALLEPLNIASTWVLKTREAPIYILHRALLI